MKSISSSENLDIQATVKHLQWSWKQPTNLKLTEIWDYRDYSRWCHTEIEHGCTTDKLPLYKLHCFGVPQLTRANDFWATP